MKIVLISDTHCKLRKIDIPDGDVLLHAGDLTFSGWLPEISQELREFERIAKRFSSTIFVPGNHDRLFETNMPLAKKMFEDVGITILHDSGIKIKNINVWGSAWQPAFCNWAFNVPRGEALAQKWDQIPDNTDILITHGPPMGILDPVERYNGQKCEFEIEHVGCEDLYNRIQQLKQLRLHLFGHIHLGYGQLKVGDLTYVNASVCTEQYKPSNKPIIVEL